MIKDGKDDMRQAFKLPKEFRERPCTFKIAQRLAEDFGLVQGWLKFRSCSLDPHIFHNLRYVVDLGQSKVYARVLWWYSLGLWSEHSRNSANCWEAPGNSQWNIVMWTRVTRKPMDECWNPIVEMAPKRSQQVVLMHWETPTTWGNLWKFWGYFGGVEWFSENDVQYTVCNMYSLFNIIINMLLYWYVFYQWISKKVSNNNDTHIYNIISYICYYMDLSFMYYFWTVFWSH